MTAADAAGGGFDTQLAQRRGGAPTAGAHPHLVQPQNVAIGADPRHLADFAQHVDEIVEHGSIQSEVVSSKTELDAKKEEEKAKEEEAIADEKKSEELPPSIGGATSMA